MKNFALLAIFSCFYLFVNAQNIKELGSVSGAVRDESTGEIIDFAGVSIYKTGNENALKNFMTDPEGKFVFNDLPFGTYKIKVSFMGYQAKTVEEIIVNAEN